jgi:hypothetical protein
MSITQQNVPIGGAVIKFTPCKNVHLKTLADGWKALGLEDYIPEPRTALSCLRAAIGDAYAVDDPKQQRLAIRSIPKGFAIVVERPKDEKHAGDDWGEVLATAKLGAKDEAVQLDPYDYDKLAQITAGMAGAKEYVCGSSVTSALVAIIDVWGLTLREAGGMYWLNSEQIPAWDCVCQKVIAACPKQDHDGNDVQPWKFGKLNVIADADMVATIGDDLTREIESELARIEYELNMTGEEALGTRAIENRERRSQHLLDKVAKYAECFQRPLTALEERVQRTQVAAGMAKLAAIVKAEQEAAKEQGVAA